MSEHQIQSLKEKTENLDKTDQRIQNGYSGVQTLPDYREKDDFIPGKSTPSGDVSYLLFNEIETALDNIRESHDRYGVTKNGRYMISTADVIDAFVEEDSELENSHKWAELDLENWKDIEDTLDAVMSVKGLAHSEKNYLRANNFDSEPSSAYAALMAGETQTLTENPNVFETKHYEIEL